MATEDESVVSPEPEPAPEAGFIPHAIALQKQVRAKVDELQGQGEVSNRIIAALAEKQIAERVEKLSKALSKRDQMYRDIEKIKPDNIGLDFDGKKISESFTKAKYEELKKAKEELNKLDKAMGKAIDKADFQDLQKFIGG